MTPERSMMVRMPDELHRAVRIKAAEIGRPISEIVRDLLQGWLAGQFELLSPNDEPNKK